MIASLWLTIFAACSLDQTWSGGFGQHRVSCYGDILIDIVGDGISVMDVCAPDVPCMGKQHRLFDLFRFDFQGLRTRADSRHVRIRLHLSACDAQRTDDQGVPVDDNLSCCFNVVAIQLDRLRSNPRTEK